MRLRIRLIAGVLASLSTLITYASIPVSPIAAATPTCSSLGFNYNIYAAGIHSQSDDGAQGYISTPSAISAPSGDFSDEALHTVDTSNNNGSEIGWYVGVGNNIAWTSTPLYYYTLNGPDETDLSTGPALGSTHYYATWWHTSTEAAYRFDSGTTLYLTDPTAWSPGEGAAVGEVNTSGVQMGQSTFSSLQYLNTSAVWSSWNGMSLCADTGYNVSELSSNSVENWGYILTGIQRERRLG